MNTSCTESSDSRQNHRRPYRQGQRTNDKPLNNTNAAKRCNTNTNTNNYNNNNACLKPNSCNENNNTRKKEFHERNRNSKPANNCNENNNTRKKEFHQRNRNSKPANPPNICRKAAGYNWKSHAENNANMPLNVQNVTPSTSNAPTSLPNGNQLTERMQAEEINKYIAIDCEMVGCGENGKESIVARVALVDRDGNVLLDEYVAPQQTVTDYRTSISGIRPQDLENANEFNEVQKEVIRLIEGKYLVGHSLFKDLAVLHIKHPKRLIRDTSTYMPLRKVLGCKGVPGLKLLSHKILGLEIQTGEHNPIEDARAAMRLYNYLCKDWEKYIKKRYIRSAFFRR